MSCLIAAQHVSDVRGSVVYTASRGQQVDYRVLDNGKAP